MQVTLDPSIPSLIHDFKIGLIHYNKIIVEDSPQMIKGRMQLYQENLVIELTDTPATERPGIKEWRNVWKQLGADPNRYRHAAERLMRRIAKQNYLTPVHSAIDLNNFFSIMHECPIGIYDIAKLKGDIQLSLGNEQIGYDGLNGRYNTLNNMLYTKDENGAFGSPFVDSTHTAVTEHTTDALQIFYLRPSLSEENALQLLNAAGKMFTQISGGNYEVKLLSASSTTIQFEEKIHD